MARLWGAGSELNLVSSEVEYLLTPSLTITGSANFVRSGSFGARIQSLSSGVGRGLLHQVLNAAAHVFVRFYFKVITRPSAANTFFIFDDDNTTIGEAAATRVGLLLTSTGRLQLFNGTTQIGSDSDVLDNNKWYLVEVEFDSIPAAGSEVLRARLEEVEFAGASNLTLALTSNIAIDLGGNLAAEAQTTGEWAFDDIAVNDAAGSFQNSWPGKGALIHLRPNAAGDNSDWTNDWQSVDEVTPDDATSICASGTLNQIDDHNIDDAPVTITDDAVISVIQVGVRFKVSSGTSTDPAFVLRIKASASGTVEEGTAILTTSAAVFFTHSQSSVHIHNLTLYDLPGASTTAWTKSDLNNAQIGYRCSTGDADQCQITTVWLLVDFISSIQPLMVKPNLQAVKRASFF